VTPSARRMTQAGFPSAAFSHESLSASFIFSALRETLIPHETTPCYNVKQQSAAEASR